MRFAFIIVVIFLSNAKAELPPIVIYNNQGKVMDQIKNPTQEQFLVSYPQGMYVLMAKNEANEIFTQKIITQ